MYSFGQPVDVCVIWAGGYELLSDWFAGRRFCSYNGDGTAMVFAKFLGLSWVKVRYRLEDIRPTQRGAIGWQRPISPRHLTA